MVGENISPNEFFDYLQKNGIWRQFSCRYTPQQNGVTKRKNRHIAQIAHVLMTEKNMPHSYWAETSFTVVYIMNMTTTVAIHDVTPEEKYV